MASLGGSENMQSELGREQWHEICFFLSEDISYNTHESIFEQRVLMVLEKLGWSKFRDEIVVRPPLQDGRKGSIEPDLVIYGSDEKALIVMEVKRTSESISKEESIRQMTPYMRQLKADFGLLIGNEIHIHYDGKLNFSDVPVCLARIAFDRNSENGPLFVSLFSREAFLEKQYESYLSDAISRIRNKHNLQNLKTALVSEETKEKILEFIRNEFSDYGSTLVDEALDGIELSLTIKMAAQKTPAQKEPGRSTKTRRLTPKERESSASSDYVPNKEYTLDALQKMSLGRDTRPSKLIIEGRQYSVRTWTDLCEDFVSWLIDNGYLSLSNIPMYNHTERDKYFINVEPEHQKRGKTAQWVKVGSFFVDTKYNAEAHKENIIHTLAVLDLRSINLAIAFS
jgi:hypothetical protein